MTAYNEGTLNKLSKKELIGITLSRQNKVEQYTNVNTDALEEIRKFNENFIKLESKINIVKKVNALLNKRVIDMERQCRANAQFLRREFLEIVGIPPWNRKWSKSLVKLVVRSYHAILRHVIVSLTMIESLFNFCDQVMSVKRDLRKLNLEDSVLRGSNSIFINPSLCPYYKMLCSKSKRLLDLGKISNFYISSGKIKIKLQENSKRLAITLVEVFKKYFPDVDLTPSS